MAGLKTINLTHSGRNFPNLLHSLKIPTFGNLLSVTFTNQIKEKSNQLYLYSAISRHFACQEELDCTLSQMFLPRASTEKNLISRQKPRADPRQSVKGFGGLGTRIKGKMGGMGMSENKGAWDVVQYCIMTVQW